MGRGKLRMELIKNEASRRTTFQKRKKGLMRKAYELSTLCDVPICVIASGPTLQKYQQPAELETWPPNPNDIRNMINTYKTSGSHKRVTKYYDVYDFFTERKKKVELEISKLHKDIAEARYPKWDDCIEHLSGYQIRLFIGYLDTKLEIANMRINLMERDQCLKEKGISSMLDGFHVQPSQNHFDHKCNFRSKLDLEFPFQIPSQNHTPITNPLTRVKLDGFDCTEFFGASGTNTQFGATTTLFNSPSFNDPLFGMLENVLFNDPSSSMCHYNIPTTQSVLPESYVQQHLGISSVSPAQIASSNQLNEFDYKYEFLTNSNKI